MQHTAPGAPRWYLQRVLLGCRCCSSARAALKRTKADVIKKTMKQQDVEQEKTTKEHLKQGSRRRRRRRLVWSSGDHLAGCEHNGGGSSLGQCPPPPCVAHTCAPCHSAQLCRCPCACALYTHTHTHNKTFTTVGFNPRYARTHGSWSKRNQEQRLQAAEGDSRVHVHKHCENEEVERGCGKSDMERSR